jgi:hypothetical protein
MTESRSSLEPVSGTSSRLGRVRLTGGDGASGSSSRFRGDQVRDGFRSMGPPAACAPVFDGVTGGRESCGTTEEATRAFLAARRPPP